MAALVVIGSAGVVETYGQWTPPLGIPAPSFGITETAPAHPTNWQSAVAGFYYIDRNHPSATDSGNAFGTEALPRLTIPANLPVGSVVEIHGTYDFAPTEHIPVTGSGTPAQPIFIRGRDSGTKPTITKKLSPQGSYQIFENLEFVAGSSFEIIVEIHHVALRHSVAHGMDHSFGRVLSLIPGNDGSHWIEDIVFYNNQIHDLGDWTSVDEKDWNGIIVQRQTRRVWIVDNEIFNCQGDSVAVNTSGGIGTNPGEFIYIGRNLMYENQENGVDLKVCYDVIVSQNEIYEMRDTPGADPGLAVVVHNDQAIPGHPLPDRIWLIANHIHDCDGGPIFENVQDCYFVGNIVHDIINQSPRLINKSSAFGRGAPIRNIGGRNVTIANNIVYNCDYGITAFGGFNATSCDIFNNIIFDLTDSHFQLFGIPGWHLVVDGPSSNLFTADHNLFFEPGGTPHIKWTPFGEFSSLASYQAGTGQGTGSLDVDPLVVDAVNGDFHPTAGSPTLGVGASPSYKDEFFTLYGIELFLEQSGFLLPEGNYDIGAFESTQEPVPPPSLIYVDPEATGPEDGTTWTNAFALLSDALTSAGLVESAEIWVANGTYRPSTAGLGDSRDATFTLMGKVAIYGGFEGVSRIGGGETLRTERNSDPSTNGTILSGDLGANDGPGTFDNNGENAYHVVTASGTDGTAVLDGFSIRGGNANSTSDRSLGAGIYNVGGSPTLGNCLVKGNRANADGAGMYNIGDTLIAAAKLTNCTFEANETATSNGDGAGIYNQLANPTLTGCVFTLNKALGNGGGFYNFSNGDPNTWPTLTGCTFASNESIQKSGGGAYMVGGGPTGGPSLSDCTFTSNTCNLDGGGMRYEDGDGFITNSTFTGNDATNGGGMSIFDCEPVVRGCTFVGNTAVQRGGGIRNSRNDGAIVNCKFLGNIVEQNGGGLHNSNAKPVVINCVFSGNKAGNMLQAGSGGGIWNGDSTTADLQVLNCTISENEAATSGGAFYNQNSADPIITNSIIWNNRVNGVISGAGQIFIDSGTVTVTYSCVRDDEVNGGSVYPGTGNIDADPSLVDPDGLDNVFGTLDDNLALTFPAPVSPCTDTGLNAAIPKDVGDLDFDGDLVEDIPFDLVGFSRVFSIVDMGALESGLTLAPPRLFVNHAATGSNNGTSWENAYTELSAAVFQAGNSQGAVSEIWVATGTYRPTSAGGDRETSFELASGLRITGGFVSGAMSLAESDSLMNPTVMSGDLNGDDSGVDNKSENSHHVVTADFGVDDTGILEGFTISGGNANGVGQLSQGSGIHIVGGDPQILNCIFTDGLATADGSAVYIINGNPIFLDCTIFGNTGVNGTVFASGGEPLFGRCVFRNNQAGIGGGIYAVSTRAVVMNSYILSNTAVSGGGLFSVGASGEFLNCLFSGNTAEVGAGLYSFLDIEDGFRVTNCTVTGNTANVTAGGLFNSDSSIPSMSNCIVWANTDGGVDIPSAQIFNESASSATLVNHSCVQDDDASDASVYAGTNNIDDDPQFLDADGIDDTFGTLDDNPAPDGGSPVIDAGDNSVVSADVLDLDADANDTEAVPLDLLLNTRFRNVTTDMGAIEFDPAKSSIVFYMADSDLDGDVDGVDFAKFAQCFNKAGNPPRTLGCPPENADIFDFDDDADVDGVDFAQFAQCFNKAGNPPRTLGCQAY